jgi:hypothetical protein
MHQAVLLRRQCSVHAHNSSMTPMHMKHPRPKDNMAFVQQADQAVSGFEAEQQLLIAVLFGWLFAFFSLVWTGLGVNITHTWSG